MRLGVALSGGGHRATAWGWGALLGLAECGVNEDVVSISSVSGGSIANGVLANEGDYSKMRPEDVEQAIRPGLRVVAAEGLFFPGPATDGYVARVLTFAAGALAGVVALVVGAIGFGREWPPLPFAVLGVPLALVAWIRWLRTAEGVRAARSGVLLALLATGPAAALVIALTADGGGAGAASLLVATALVAVVCVVAARLFAQRSIRVDAALASTLLHREGRPTQLADADHNVHHVFCATELQSGDQAYFTPRLVYGYRIGRGRPGSLALSTAVQASACLPGAFVPRELDTTPFGLERPWPVRDDQPPQPPAHIVVNDGGVYDNMADQWEQGLRSRLRRLPDLATLQPPADTLIVANAGKALGWSPLRRAGLLAAEVRGLARSVDILYDVSTSHRRQGLVSRFADGDGGLAGCLVHIAQSPFTVPRAFVSSSDEDLARRASEALALLAALGADEKVWKQRAERNARVPTVLSALGVDATVDLLEHACLLAVVNPYVVLGAGRLPAPDRLARSRFASLVSQ